MDELELLKKDWQRNTVQYPKLSYNEIYKMSHAKSSSIVKWIFYISIAEFIFLTSLNILNPKVDTSIEYPQWINVVSYLSIPVTLFFIYLFYKNYKIISANDSIRKLIKSILKVRRIVKYYVFFNLIIISIFSSVVLSIGYINSVGGAEQFNVGAHFKEYAMLGIVVTLITVVLIGFFCGVYYLLYGILLKRLNKNYRELKKLE